jgi:hypothetical protein
VHSNSDIKIYDTGATFKGPGMVTTAGTVQGKQYGTFVGGYKERVARIEMPETAELSKLKNYATAGGTAFTEPTPSTQTRMRIEFLWIDVNDNNSADPDEGFFRVYVASSTKESYMLARRGSGNLTDMVNCGYTNATTGLWVPTTSGATSTARRNILTDPRRRCYLGGDPMLNDSVFDPENSATGNGWLPRTAAWNGPMPAKINSRPDKNYLFPLSRTYNANYKGVIHVTGSVAISGRIRGRVTIAATEDIFIADDLTYMVQPGGSADCLDVDMAGLFAGRDVVIADNVINTPQQVNGGTTTYYNYDDNTDVFLHGVVLALDVFTVENYTTGPSNANDCENTNWGRGCLYLSGGVIQNTRGAVGLSDGHGFLKRYSYDVCAAKKPPPYFPTTGRFTRSRYYEIDPVNFDVGTFFRRWSAG